MLQLSLAASSAFAEPSPDDPLPPLPHVSAAPPFATDPTSDLLPPGMRVEHGREASIDHTVRERVEQPGQVLEVEFTVDSALDERVREVLAAGRIALGHVILMDPSSGEIFSYVSTAPELFPATRAYPTASLMKVVTAAAVLRHAPEAVDRDCRYLGNPYELRKPFLRAPARGGRVDSFWRAIAISNNQCFGRLAIHDVGEVALLQEMRSVGMLDAPAANHAAGRVGAIDGDLDLAYLGSGLAKSFVTPLAAIRLAALLDDGKLVTPYWIAHVRDEQGRYLWLPERPAPRRVWSPQIAHRLREQLVSVTTEGTASRAFKDSKGKPLLGSIQVSGKTGTLSGTNPDGTYQWFIGVAPADEPQFAIASIVVRDGRGGVTASQVAAATLKKIFCRSEGCHATLGKRVHARAERRDAVAIDAAAGQAAQRARILAAIEAAELARIYEVSELDEIPKPVGTPELDFPHRLLSRRVRGKIVLNVLLDREGGIAELEIESSDLPRYEKFVLKQVRDWKFTQPKNKGRPVQARSLVSIPIIIK